MPVTVQQQATPVPVTVQQQATPVPVTVQQQATPVPVTVQTPAYRGSRDAVHARQKNLDLRIYIILPKRKWLLRQTRNKTLPFHPTTKLPTVLPRLASGMPTGTTP